MAVLELCWPAGTLQEYRVGKGMNTDPVPSTSRSQGSLLYRIISLTRVASRHGLLSQPRGIRLPGIGTPASAHRSPGLQG